MFFILKRPLVSPLSLTANAKGNTSILRIGPTEGNVWHDPVSSIAFSYKTLHIRSSLTDFRKFPAPEVLTDTRKKKGRLKGHFRAQMPVRKGKTAILTSRQQPIGLHRSFPSVGPCSVGCLYRCRARRVGKASSPQVQLSYDWNMVTEFPHLRVIDDFAGPDPLPIPQ